MSFQDRCRLMLVAHCTKDSNETFDICADMFDRIETNMNGLREFFRNIDTVHIKCSTTCAIELKRCDFNASLVFLYRAFPESFKVDRDTISGYIYIEDSDRVYICLRKSLKLPYDNLITSFKITGK